MPNFYSLSSLGLSTDSSFSETDFVANIKTICDAADTKGSCEQWEFAAPFGTSNNLTKSILAKMMTDLGYQFDCYIDLVIRKYNTGTAQVYIYTQGYSEYRNYAIYSKVRFEDSYAGPFTLYHHPDGFGMTSFVKLWENSSKTLEFAEQTLDLGLTDYDMYIIVARTSTSISGTVNVICATGYTSRLQVNPDSSSTSTHPFRTITYSSGSLKIGNCTASGSTNNAYLIPIFIYGIKGVI